MNLVNFRANTGEQQSRRNRDRRDRDPHHCGTRRSRLHPLRRGQDVQGRVETQDHEGLQRRRRPEESAAEHDGV